MGSTDIALLGPDGRVAKSRVLSPATEGPYAAAAGGMGIMRGATPKRGARMLRNFSENNEWVRAALSRRKHALMSAEWQIVRRDKKAVNPKVVAAIGALFDEVNPTRESFGTLLSKTVEDILVLDAGCIEKEKSLAGEILALWPVDGATIAVDSAWEKTCDPGGIRYRQFAGYKQIGQARNDQLIYIQHNPRTNSPIGWSPVETCVRVIEASLYAEQYDSDSLRQNAPEGVLDFGAGINARELEIIREYYETEIAGSRKLMITGGGLPLPGQSAGGRSATYIPFKGDASAVARAIYKKWLATVICASFEMDLTSFNLTESVNRANSRTGQEQTDKGLVGLASVVSDFLTRELVWEFDPDHAFVFSGLVQRDDLNQAKIDQIYMSIGVTFPNEIRAREGLEPVEWGDEPYNAAGSPTPDPADPDAVDPGAEPADPNAPPEPEPGKGVRAAKNPFGVRAGR